jgi:8-oxo-dGTP diphosphatase
MIPAEERIDLKRGIDHIGVGVCCVLHDGQGNILLMKRGEQARDERGKWDICGGAIEFGESIDEALEREIMEELCAEPFNIEFVKAYDAHRNHEGNKTHWVQLLHIAQVDPLKVAIGEPHKIAEIGWFNSSNLPSPRHSQFEKSFGSVCQLGIIK